MSAPTKKQRAKAGRASRMAGKKAERDARTFLLGLTNRHTGKKVFLSVERNLSSMAGLGGDDLICITESGETWNIEVKEWKSVPLSPYASMTGTTFQLGPGGGELLHGEQAAWHEFSHSLADREDSFRKIPAHVNWPRCKAFFDNIRNADVLMFRRKDNVGWPWLFYWRRKKQSRSNFDEERKKIIA